MWSEAGEEDREAVTSGEEEQRRGQDRTKKKEREKRKRKRHQEGEGEGCVESEKNEKLKAPIKDQKGGKSFYPAI